MAKNFVIKWKGSNGQAFEGLVGELLKQMYPNYNFKHTEYSHDGGKDFYAMGENNTSDTIWVEAKTILVIWNSVSFLTPLLWQILVK